MKYTVGYIRSQGIECRWTHTRHGSPIIVGKTDTPGKDGRPIWAAIDAKTWDRAHAVGLTQAFQEATALIGYFSIPL